MSSRPSDPRAAAAISDIQPYQVDEQSVESQIAPIELSGTADLISIAWMTYCCPSCFFRSLLKKSPRIAMNKRAPMRASHPAFQENSLMEIKLSKAPIHNAVATNTNQQLSSVQDLLSLSISDLGEAFHVSRQSLVKWANGEPLGEDNAAKLQDIVRVADVIAQAGFAKDRSLLRRRFSHGKTFLQVLAVGGSALKELDTLIAILQREQIEYARLQLRFADRTCSTQSADFDFPAAG